MLSIAVAAAGRQRNSLMLNAYMGECVNVNFRSGALPHSLVIARERGKALCTGTVCVSDKMETRIQCLAIFGIVTTYDIANYLDELFPKQCISIYDSDKTTSAVIR